MLMGVIEPVPVRPDTATVWVGLNGQVISCDRALSDWFAYQPQELVESPITGLAIKHAAMLDG